MNTSKLNLGWWNIGISPPIRSNKTKKTDAITLAGNYITQFIQQRELFFSDYIMSDNDDILNSIKSSFQSALNIVAIKENIES